MSNFNPDLAAQNDVESTLPKLNFGKGTLRTSRFIRWDDHPTEKNAKGKPKRIAVSVSAEEFKSLPNGNRTQEVYVGIDIQEFNPALDFQYERKMNIGDVDWNGVFKASLYQVLGLTAKQNKDEETAQISSALKDYMSSYWATEDVLQTPTERTPHPKYNTVKVVKKFASREECYAEWQATYKSSNGSNGHRAPQTSAAPAGFSPQEWQGSKVDVIDFYKGAYTKAKGSPELRRKKAMEETIGYWWNPDPSLVTEEERSGWETAIASLNIKLD